MDDIAPMLVLMTLILTTGAVALLRPLAKRLGDLLELRAKQARGEIENPQMERMERTLESLSSRLALLEERQDFADSLLRRPEGEARKLGSPDKERWE